MMDYSLCAIPKVKPGTTPKALAPAAKARKEAKAWRSTKKTVDERDAVDGDPVCFITGKRLQNRNTLDEKTFRDRAHLDARSTNKARRYDSTNVVSVSRLAHKAIDASALLLFNKRGQPARTVATIDHVAWNRRLVRKGEEPFRIRKGLAVVELEQVRD